mgnify:CR=1 FL=1
MANLIVLEGLSRTGKTTIAKQLHANGFGKIISLNEKMPDNTDLESFYKGCFSSYDAFFKTLKDETFILDRSFLSEMVYPKLFNRNSVINDNYLKSFLSNNVVCTYYLTNTHADYMKRNPKDSYIYSKDDYSKLKKFFDDSVKSLKKNHLAWIETVNTSKLDLEKTTNLIIDKQWKIQKHLLR